MKTYWWTVTMRNGNVIQFACRETIFPPAYNGMISGIFADDGTIYCFSVKAVQDICMRPREDA